MPTHARHGPTRHWHGRGSEGQPDHRTDRDANPILGAELKMKILTDVTGNVFLRLRNSPPDVKKSAEVIIDLNTQGNWIRGFEMVGGMFELSLRKAVEPFHAKEPELGDVGAGVTSSR
jgi:hypothetical protein